MHAKVIHVAKFGIALLWLGVFVYQMSFIFAKWMANETATSTQYIHNKKLQLPYITLCPKKPFKCTMRTFTEDEYLNCTYSFEELFPNEKRNGAWNVTSFRTSMNGRCYTFHHLKEVKQLQTSLGIGLQKDMNVYGN